MSEESVFKALETTGLPVFLLGAHDCEKLPRISYSMPDDPGFFADDSRFATFTRCEVRLYTDAYPEPETEALVDAALDKAGYAFSKVRTPIESERMHQTTYTFTDVERN